MVVGIVAAIESAYAQDLGRILGIVETFEQTGTEMGKTIMSHGSGGLLASLFVVFFGGAAAYGNSRIPGVFVVLCAFAGIYVGAAAIFEYMMIAIMGGILAMLGKSAKH